MQGNWRSMPFTEAVEVNPKVSMKRGEAYPFVDLQSINPSRPFVSPARVRSFTGGGARFEPGDILMARITPSLENGKIARYMPDDRYPEPAFGSTELIVIRGKKGVTRSDFAFYLTKWEAFRTFAIAQMSGSSGRQRVPPESLAGFITPVPTLQEQHAIAHILGTLDDKIELNRRMNETLEAMARALFKSWFVDFDPVVVNAIKAGNPIPEKFAKRAAHYRQNPDALRLPEHILRLFPDRFVDSELGPIPVGWEVGVLGDAADYRRRTIRPAAIRENTPYIALEHMPKRSIALSQWSTADGLQSTKFEFKKGEILFGKLRPYFHKVGVAPVDGVCSTDIVVIAPKRSFWFGFVLGHVSSVDFVEYTNAGSTGTKMPRTNWTQMAAYELVVPTEPAAEAFSEAIRPLVVRILDNLHKSRTLAALRDTLLPKLISGELRVPDAEKLLEDAP